MSDTTQLIKERLDVASFLKEYLKLIPAGKNFKANCPFHKEKTPSLIISPDKGIWHCFGCSVGGDVIKFLMMYENLEFYDALKVLAEKAGVELKTIANRDFHSHNNLYKAVNAAKDFFKKELAASPSNLKYFLDRGLKAETIQEFELGMAPAASDGLMRYLVKNGFNVLDLEKSGLVLKTERGTYWDRFRGRMMFPLYNHFGKVVGFTGRVLPGQESDNVGKYVNSPETPIFQKSKFLYGFHKNKNEIRQSGAAVLVEGQMDLLMAWQDGIKNIAATSGTALTADHLAVLRRACDSLVIGFDNDDAGIAAAERAIDMAGALDFNTRVLLLNGAKDPADLAQKEPGRLKDLVASALPAIQYYFYKHINSLKSQNIIEKKKGIRAVLGKIKVLESAVERSHWLKELSTLANLDENILAEEMARLNVAEATLEKSGTLANSEAVSRKDLISERILSLAVSYPQLQNAIKADLAYLPILYRGVFTQLVSSANPVLANSNADLDNLVSLINLRSSLNNADLEEKKIIEELQELFRQLKKDHFKERRKEIRVALGSAKNEEESGKLLQEHALIDQEDQKL